MGVPAQNSKSDKGSSIDPKIMIVGIIAAIALIAYFVTMESHTLAPPDDTYAKSLAAAHYTTPAWLANDAKQSGGDFSKLNSTEQQKILAMCKGNAHDAANAVAGAYSLTQ